MPSVNRLIQSNVGLSQLVSWMNIRATAHHQLQRLAGVCQTVINLAAPTGYEDNAGFHPGVAQKSIHQAGESNMECEYGP